MSSVPSLIAARIAAAAGIDPELRPATKPQFGHFQSNVALRLAKSQGRNPREVAADLVERVELSELAEPLEIAGPGFINIRLRPEVLAAEAERVRTDPAHGVVPAEQAQTVVIDLSSPNVAKQMHVGHLRSTIIGDALHRVLRAIGHRVIPQNHIGDWGRQFGMLVEQILDEGIDPGELDLAGAEALYLRANAHFKESEEFAERARRRVVSLQASDPRTLRIWQQLIDISLAGFNQAYARLGVLLDDDDLAGESTYNDDLPRVAQELQDNGTAVIDDGALVVFVDGIDAPMIVRKSDGGFGYSATDLAAIRHRVRDLGADRIIYVVGAPQTHHFDQVFAVSRKAGFLPAEVSAEHVAFGQVLGADGKKFSTREGSAVALMDLLDAAEAEAAPPVALAAIKYADLSNSLVKDYTFDVDRMVRTTGNTGPYLQYAHARCHQVLRRGEAEGFAIGPIRELTESAEQQLALKLTEFDDAVHAVADTLAPHKLTTFLYELAELFSTFYELCPVLKSDDPVRASRLGLVQATLGVLAAGLDMLGIAAPDRM